MNSNTWIAIILAVAVAAGVFFWSQSREAPIVPADAPSQSQVPQDSEENEPAITNYEECIAAGNSPLPDAPDKCLTRSGYIFIQGVIEE